MSLVEAAVTVGQRGVRFVSSGKIWFHDVASSFATLFASFLQAAVVRRMGKKLVSYYMEGARAACDVSVRAALSPTE